MVGELTVASGPLAFMLRVWGGRDFTIGPHVQCRAER
jgi:hypothetical protein